MIKLLCMKILLWQRRFLIIWCIFHLCALFVNIVPINGDMGCDYKNNECTNLFTNSANYHYQSSEGFWPFVNYHTTMVNFGRDAVTQRPADLICFNGIFYNYSYSAFFIYVILGFAIVFIPKLWNSSGR